jgi:hypothetical protein
MSMAHQIDNFMSDWLTDFITNQGGVPVHADMIEAGWASVEVAGGIPCIEAEVLAVRLFGTTGFIMCRMTRHFWFDTDADALMFTLAFGK